MMIRPVLPTDAPALTDIYNHYVTQTTVTFETTPLTVADMSARIADISAHHPYFVYEENGEILGYCYAHLWRERAAYRYTWETTVYVAPHCRAHGIGRQLMEALLAACRQTECRVLIACITAENEESCRFHRRLGFKQVSLFEGVGVKFGRVLDVVDYELKCPFPSLPRGEGA